MRLRIVCAAVCGGVLCGEWFFFGLGVGVAFFCYLIVIELCRPIFQTPIKSFALPIRGLQEWFDCMVVLRKREEIAALLKSLVRQHNPARADLFPSIVFPTKDGKLL